MRAAKSIFLSLFLFLTGGQLALAQSAGGGGGTDRPFGIDYSPEAYFPKSPYCKKGEVRVAWRHKDRFDFFYTCEKLPLRQPHYVRKPKNRCAEEGKVLPAFFRDQTSDRRDMAFEVCRNGKYELVEY